METPKDPQGAAGEEQLPKLSPDSNVREKYIPIRFAGEGEDTEVYFCIPKSEEVTSQIAEAKKHAEQGVKSLMSKLVAVKVAKPGLRHTHTLNKEIRILQSILTCQKDKEQEQAPGQLQEQEHHCIELLAHDSAFGWLALPAYTSSLTLHSFIKSIENEKGVMPEELIYHSFIQIMETLNFLQNVCEPPIAHADFHAGNIMLGPSTKHFPGFPNLILIDFGNALDFDCVFKCTRDYHAACELIYDMNKLRPRCYHGANSDRHKKCGHSEGWVAFRSTLRQEADNLPENVMHMLKLHGQTARKGTTLNDIKELVEWVTSEGNQEVEKELAKFLEIS